MIKKYNKFVEDRLVKEDKKVKQEHYWVEEIPEEEEGGKYIVTKMDRLASMLGVDKS
jgi:hypothetical protein